MCLSLDGWNVAWYAVDWAGPALSAEILLQALHNLAFFHCWFATDFYGDHSPGSFCDVMSSFTTSRNKKVGSDQGLFFYGIFDRENNHKKFKKKSVSSMS